MLKRIAAATVVTAASLSFAGVALAQSEFDAKPMSSGPPNMMMMPTAQPAPPPAPEPMAKPMKKHHHKKMAEQKAM